jgi:integrase
MHTRDRIKVIARVIGHLRLIDVSGRHLDMLAAELNREGKAATTIASYVVEARGALKQARRWRMINGEPWIESTIPKAHRKAPKVSSAAEAERVAVKLEATNPIAAMLVRLAAGTGARVGELIALHWVDVAADHSAISIHRSAWDAHCQKGIRNAPKTTSSRRLIELPAATREALARYRAWHQAREQTLPGWSQGLVFPKPTGGLWRPSAAVLTVRRAQIALGLPSGMHVFRHGHATTLIEAGVSVKAIAERLGHASPTLVLSTYAHVTPSGRDAVLKALDQAMGAPGAPDAPGSPA